MNGKLKIGFVLINLPPSGKLRQREEGNDGTRRVFMEFCFPRNEQVAGNFGKSTEPDSNSSPTFCFLTNFTDVVWILMKQSHSLVYSRAFFFLSSLSFSMECFYIFQIDPIDSIRPVNSCWFFLFLQRPRVIRRNYQAEEFIRISSRWKFAWPKSESPHPWPTLCSRIRNLHK